MQKDGVITIPTGVFQPIAADDVAASVAVTALAAPRNGTRNRVTRESALCGGTEQSDPLPSLAI